MVHATDIYKREQAVYTETLSMQMIGTWRWTAVLMPYLNYMKIYQKDNCNISSCLVVSRTSISPIICSSEISWLQAVWPSMLSDFTIARLWTLRSRIHPPCRSKVGFEPCCSWRDTVIVLACQAELSRHLNRGFGNGSGNQGRLIPWNSPVSRNTKRCNRLKCLRPWSLDWGFRGLSRKHETQLRSVREYL